MTAPLCEIKLHECIVILKHSSIFDCNYSSVVLIFSFFHAYRPYLRVIRLIKRMGAQPHPKQKRILCINKVDLVEKKKDLLKAAAQFKDLPGFERLAFLAGREKKKVGL